MSGTNRVHEIGTQSAAQKSETQFEQKWTRLWRNERGDACKEENPRFARYTYVGPAVIN